MVVHKYFLQSLRHLPAWGITENKDFFSFLFQSSERNAQRSISSGSFESQQLSEYIFDIILKAQDSVQESLNALSLDSPSEQVNATLNVYKKKARKKDEAPTILICYELTEWPAPSWSNS